MTFCHPLPEVMTMETTETLRTSTVKTAMLAKAARALAEAQDNRAGVLRLQRQVHLALHRARVLADLPVTRTEIMFQTSMRLFARSVAKTSSSATSSPR